MTINISKKSSKELALAFKKSKSNKDYNLLYNKIIAGLRNYVLGIVKDEDVMKDIVSNTMLKVYSRIDEYDPSYQITTWSYRIAYNESIQYIRQRNKSVSLSIGFDVTNEDSENGSDDLSGRNRASEELSDMASPDNYKNPEDFLAEDNKLTEDYNNAIDKIYALKPLYRDFAIYRLLNDMSYKEIEDRINKPHIDKYNQMVNNAKRYQNSGDIEMYNKKVSEAELYKKENLIDMTTVKNRVNRGRKIIQKELRACN